MSNSLFLRGLMVFETIKQRKGAFGRRPDISSLVRSFVRHQAVFYIYNKESFLCFNTTSLFQIRLFHRLMFIL